MQMDDPPTVFILLLGNSGCGKSTFLSGLSHSRRGTTKTKEALLLRDLDQPFVYDIRMYNRPYRLKFFDTASPENYTLLQPNVVVLCYDISDRRSLKSLQEKWKDVTRLYINDNPNIPVVLLGLKRDLRTEGKEDANPFEAHRIAQEMWCDAYMECSATTGQLMDEVMEDIARLAAKTTTAKGALSEPSCSLM